jgi:lipoyl(octanoyl) transferase
MDLEPFRRINPCGFQGLQVTQVLDLGGPGALVAVEDVLIEELSRQFGFTPQAAAAELPLAAASDAAHRVA